VSDKPKLLDFLAKQAVSPTKQILKRAVEYQQKAERAPKAL
jgi:hypothetical protein